MEAGVNDVNNIIDRISQLPWAPAETLAKVEHYVIRTLTYGALAYSSERMAINIFF